MNVIGTALGAGTALAVFGALAALAAPRRVRTLLAHGSAAATGGAGLVAGFAATGGRTWHASLPGVLPPAGMRFSVDALSGWFITISAIVVITTSVFGIGELRRRESMSDPPYRSPSPALPVFAATLLMVPAADSVSTFVWCWESMALTSLLLVLTEHRRRPAVAEAGVWYAAMTQAGFAAVLAGLALLAANAGGESFEALRAAHVSPLVRDTAFVATFAGFASKCGAVPLHAWMPRAYREAPSHAAALMSAAMANLGVYGIVRVTFDLLGGGPNWWGLVVLTVGGLSAVYGILQAVIASDLKVLLAGSSTENMGLVLIGVGAAVLLGSSRHGAVAALALSAALLHLVNHAAFKALAFLAAGSVRGAAGTTDLDQLGGLRGRMPVTTAAFSVAALGAAALPLGCGFVSEWLLLQALLAKLGGPSLTVTVAVQLSIGAVALSAGLAVATFVKALGVGFLARPRGTGAAAATESPLVMLAPMAALAGLCAGLAVFPTALVPALSRAVASAGPAGRAVVGDGVTLRLSGISSALSPLWIAAVLLAVVVACLLALRLTARSPRRMRAALWDCGGGPPTPRMQYTATSFAEPVQRVFDDVLAPQIDVDVTHVEESAYLLARVRYARDVPDRVEARMYRPVLSAVRRLADRARALGNGSVHRYLGYGFYSLVAMLSVLAVSR